MIDRNDKKYSTSTLPAFAMLSGNARFLAETYPPVFVFAVVSWGCSATGWLARVLNSHPDILCLHAGSSFWAELSNTPPLDSISYIRILACLGYAHKVAGDIHGVARHDIPQLREAFGSLFNAAVVVRDPLPRLRSQLALFERSGWSDHWRTDDIPAILHEKNVILPTGNKQEMLFVHGARMLNAITEEFSVGNVYRSEDLTSSTDMLSEFISDISQGTVQSENTWLEDAVAVTNINSHANPKTEISFSDWQMDVITKIVEPAAWEYYEVLGYQRPDFL